MARAAAAEIADIIRRRIADAGHARVVFAAAPSQAETLQALALEPDIDWGAVTAFHMDEYLGIDADAPQRFGTWLREALFDRVPVGRVELLMPVASPDADAEVARYAALLDAAPLDLVVCGIGVNGHLAFNDPPADFTTSATVIAVLLSRESRLQQVNDGLFSTIEEVPEWALTMTIPALLSARSVVCVVPGSHKAEAVRAAVDGPPMDPGSPASALRTHPDVSLYLDAESAQLLRHATLEPTTVPAAS